MPAYYRMALSAFVEEDPAGVLWKLTRANAAERFALTPQAIESWHAQLPTLSAAIAHLLSTMPQSRDWSLLLEYPIPIVGKRIDAVILARNFVVVIEIKTGNSPTTAVRQVDDYALNLACFHEETKGKTVVPVVVTDGPTATSSSVTDFDALIEKCQITSAAKLGCLLENISETYADFDQPSINAETWDFGRFRPIPPIIDAAVALYAGMDVFEIGHACAAREDLARTTDTLIKIVVDAQTRRDKVICFTTGVPGAGKTLVGLNTVHRPEIKNFSSFLSGNGPLVKVIQEALVRDVVKRSGLQEARVGRRQAELEIQAFVHNVHRFADQYYGQDRYEPAQNVIVFDEAQRAWDGEQNARANRPPVSEPEMMIEVMDRHPEWAVIIALVGGGQEINRGEAGLAEWGRALAKFPNWKVHASPEVLSPENIATGFRLFDAAADFCPERIFPSDALHLNVCTRSIRAQRISDWVDAVLLGRMTEAASIAAGLEAKPAITRSLSITRTWLNSNRRGATRAGLVASASANRLRADGLEISFDFHKGFDWEHWFLDLPNLSDDEDELRYSNDIRSSSKLEVAATQFEIQGLELDWVGLCWGEDLTWSGGEWTLRRFNNKLWKPIKIHDRRRLYLINHTEC